MKPSTARTGCACAIVAAVSVSVLMAAFGVREFSAYVLQGIIVIMALFVAMTQPCCRS